MPKREFLQLAHRYHPNLKRHFGGWMVSEKLDGIRCLHDGGISKGLAKADVPWANTAKDARYKDTQYATGLWSRYGNVIHAPGCWLKQLPAMPLDGELWVGRGEGARQRLSEIVKKIPPNVDEDAWMEEVKYRPFEVVNLNNILYDSKIDNLHYQKNLVGCYEWARNRMKELDSFYEPKVTSRYESCYKAMCMRIPDDHPIVIPIENEKLPFNNEMAKEHIAEIKNALVALGAEGTIIRNPDAIYDAFRSHDVLKDKDVNDMEGTVVGFKSGKATDKGSRLLGMIGSIIIRMDSGKTFDLSGFTDEERELKGTVRRAAAEHPGEVIPSDDPAVHFHPGDRITFSYRELTKEGYPVEARYLRPRPGVID